jgi:hypothetical protein
MECFGSYRSDNPKCTDCWLHDCCKFAKGGRQEEFLKKIKGDGLTILQFDGERLRQMRIGYDKSLLEFLSLEQQLFKRNYK